MIDFERIDRRAPTRCFTENQRSVRAKLKVIFPALRARIEERNFSFGLRVWAVRLRAFERVAERTRQP